MTLFDYAAWKGIVDAYDDFPVVGGYRLRLGANGTGVGQVVQLIDLFQPKKPVRTRDTAVIPRRFPTTCWLRVRLLTCNGKAAHQISLRGSQPCHALRVDCDRSSICGLKIGQPRCRRPARPSYIGFFLLPSSSGNQREMNRETLRSLEISVSGMYNATDTDMHHTAFKKIEIGRFTREDLSETKWMRARRGICQRILVTPSLKMNSSTCSLNRQTRHAHPRQT